MSDSKKKASASSTGKEDKSSQPNTSAKPRRKDITFQIGDTAHQNEMSRKQREAGKLGASKSPGSIKDAIITASSVTYQHSDEESKDTSKEKKDKK